MYLAGLGVSHLYTSPYLQARSGSEHGYDVVAHDRVSPDLGGDEGHQQMMDAIESSGLKHLIDVVPNHMAVVGQENRWWWDVLKHGPASRYARYFDVDWDPPDQKLKNTISVPVLEDHYGRTLEKGKIKLLKEGEELVVGYESLRFPLAPDSLDEDVDDKDIARINSDPDAIHSVLDKQNYRLSYWRTAAKELGYRRFFDVNELAGLRVEDREVFEGTHRLILGWVGEGKVQGLRIDHPDGLRDPRSYLERLAADAPSCWLLVEKILGDEERLPDDWPVDGTTGYEFVGLVLRVLIDGDSEQAFTEIYEGFTASTDGFHEIARTSKLYVLDTTLETDLRRLTELLVTLCESRRRYRDFTKSEIYEALRETLACFPVYRTYAAPGRPPTASEEAVISGAVSAAISHRPDLDPDLFGLMRDLLLTIESGEREMEFVLRFQQLSAPVMAKGVEDTSFYRYNRFIALNEVGSEPSVFHRGVDHLHLWNKTAQEKLPLTLLATSTHDTKRSEDVRARLAVLSEIPEGWRAAALRWAERNRSKQPERHDPHLEYLFYQSLVGAHPLDIERAQAFMLKAAREAKRDTSWLHPDEGFEDGLRGFVESCMNDTGFLEDLALLVDQIRDPGWINSLTQTAIKLMSPGVPDIYQGCELWDFSLVDPDNRRPVDFTLRRRLLEEVGHMSAQEAWDRRADGSPKLLLIHRVLGLRKRSPDLFAPDSSYEPLAVTGAKTNHVVGFIRGGGAALVAPRLVTKLNGDWEDTAVDLGSGRWRDVISHREFQSEMTVAKVLALFPVAILEAIR